MAKPLASLTLSRPPLERFSINMDHFDDRIREFAMKPHSRDKVICDNLPAQKIAGVEKSPGEAGASLCLVPPYSRDPNPIEKAISRVKSHTGKVGARDKATLDDSVEKAARAKQKEHAVHSINHSG